jgi:hypothetical protein
MRKRGIQFEGTVTPGKIFAVLVLAIGAKLALELASVTIGLATVLGCLGLYGVRKAIIKQMLKIKNYDANTNENN